MKKKGLSFKRKSPAEAYADLVHYYTFLYSYSEDRITWYICFDISGVSPDYPFAEAIIVNGIVAQVRVLKYRPVARSTDVKFGGF